MAWELGLLCLWGSLVSLQTARRTLSALYMGRVDGNLTSPLGDDLLHTVLRETCFYLLGPRSNWSTFARMSSIAPTELLFP